MAISLGVDHVFVGQINAARTRVTSLGGYSRSRAMGDLNYSLVGTPCENVVGQRICVYPSGVQQSFPNDVGLVRMGIEGYLGAPIWDKQGQPLGLVAALHSQPLHDPGSIKDLFGTYLDRISAEMQRARAQAALDKSEERMRLFFEHQLVGMAILSPGNTWLDVNPRCCEMLGYSRQELMECPLPELTHPDDRAVYLDLFGRLLSGAINDFCIEQRFLCRDGSVVPTNFSAACVREPDGSPDCVLGLIEDISERKRAEAERERLWAQLTQAQKMESVGRLAGGIAHDFNNVLTVINGHSQLLLRKLGIDSPFRAEIEEILKASDRAAALTRQILAFSRKQVLAPCVLDLNLTVGEMLPMLHRVMGEDVEISLREAERCVVFADPHQLHQVILNLALNARDAMPRGGQLVIETGRLTVEQRRLANAEVQPGRYVVLSVTDTGTGMDEATRQRIFEPFFTTKKAGEGTGLGLAMVDGIVAQSNGYIDVRSQLGTGTTFEIYLPELQESAATVQ